MIFDPVFNSRHLFSSTPAHDRHFFLPSLHEWALTFWSSLTFFQVGERIHDNQIQRDGGAGGDKGAWTSSSVKRSDPNATLCVFIDLNFAMWFFAAVADREPTPEAADRHAGESECTQCLPQVFRHQNNQPYDACQHGVNPHPAVSPFLTKGAFH